MREGTPSKIFLSVKVLWFISRDWRAGIVQVSEECPTTQKVRFFHLCVWLSRKWRQLLDHRLLVS